MTLTHQALDTLIDLVENKLAMLEVFDRDDARELSNLEECLAHLYSQAGRPDPKPEMVASRETPANGQITGKAAAKVVSSLTNRRRVLREALAV